MIFKHFSTFGLGITVHGVCTYVCWYLQDFLRRLNLTLHHQLIHPLRHLRLPLHHLPRLRVLFHDLFFLLFQAKEERPIT